MWDIWQGSEYASEFLGTIIMASMSVSLGSETWKFYSMRKPSFDKAAGIQLLRNYLFCKGWTDLEQISHIALIFPWLTLNK